MPKWKNYFTSWLQVIDYDHGFFYQTSARAGRGLYHSGPAVKRYRFWQDALWWSSCGLYALNRWLVKPRVHSPFLRGHFNDLLLIPCALPLILQIQQWFGLRKQNIAPDSGEIVFHLVVWSVLFEVIGPHLMKTVGDPFDILAYVAGAVVAGIWWQRHNWSRRAA